MAKISRYVSEGVKAAIPEYLQNVLWYMFDTMEVEIKDELQKFLLVSVNDKGVLKQKVIHTQDNPEYLQEHSFIAKQRVTAKVYVVCLNDVLHMILANEPLINSEPAN